MKRTTVFLSEAIECDLKGLAAQQGRPVAELVRDALTEYVAREKEKPRQPLRFLGIGQSGRTDVAERHEDLLFAELGPRPRSAARPSRAATRGSRSGGAAKRAR